MDLEIDGKKIISKNDLLDELKKQINSKEFYGDNFDALFDILLNYQGLVTIKVKNEELLIKNLKEYYVIFKKVISNLRKEGNVIDFK